MLQKKISEKLSTELACDYIASFEKNETIFIQLKEFIN